MTDTVNLGLPCIEGSQAQKHITHNDALRILDTLVQLAVLDRDLTAPPGSPAEGQRWIVKTGATGAWAGHVNAIAAWQDGAWQFSAPRTGWVAFIADEGTLLVWNGTAWGDFFSTVTSIQNLALLGVGTSADSTNPLSAKLNNALFAAKTVAEGGSGDLRYKLSKATSTNTLSFLFQDNYSGRAEIGLTDDDDFHFKVSADGSTWVDGLILDKSTGAAKFNSGLFLTGDISPAQITANQNDYDPTGLARAGVLRLSTDANAGAGRVLTGLSGGADGRIVVVANVGANPLVLGNQNAASSAANRFLLGRNVALQANSGIILYYDSTDLRWKALMPFKRGVGLFVADLNGTNQTGLTASAHNKINFNHAAVNADGWYDTVNKKYLPLESGYYHFFCSASVQHDAASQSTMVSIYKNGAQTAGSGFMNLTSAIITAQIPTVGVVLAMNGTSDYVEAYAYAAAANGIVNGNTILSYMFGYKVADL